MTVDQRQLFGAGTARGGTGLAVQTLRANSRIELAMEPFLLVFKHYRLAVHEAISRERAHRVPAMSDPIRSLYFDEADVAYLERLFGRSEDLPVSPATLAQIRDGVRGRAAYDAADLVPFVDEIAGGTFGEVIASSVAMVDRARGRAGIAWCGFLENWCIEFFPFLADLFPQSKFFVVVRDPRAVLCSALHAPPELRSTLLSYLRSIRKMFDLAIDFAGDPRFAGRLCVLKFEALVTKPEGLSRDLCAFLGVPYEPQMINPEFHVVPGSTELRDGVSSFEANATGYDPVRASRWKKLLEPDIVAAINACMATELEMFGYLEPGEAPALDAALIERLVALPRIVEIVPKWSIDMPTLAADYGAELLRAQLLAGAGAGAGGDDVRAGRLRRECFLTDRVADGLRAFRRGEPGAIDFRPFDRLVRA